MNKNQNAINILKMLTTDEFQRCTSSEFDDAIHTAIEALEKQATSEWIPVSERLPESGELVLCTADDKISQAVYVFRMGKDGKWCDFDGYEVDAAEITAWQPLPEPYKDNKK